MIDIHSIERKKERKDCDSSIFVVAELKKCKGLGVNYMKQTVHFERKIIFEILSTQIVVWDTHNYCLVCFANANKWISVWWGGAWSKSPISHKIVPRNRNSKSLEGKQIINVRWRSHIESGTIAWSKLMHLSIPLAFVYRSRTERFHTLKIELDFFSRHGHRTLCWTGVQYGVLARN